jgi:TolB protein
VALATLAAAAVGSGAHEGRPPPPRQRPLTFSGRDRDPAVSPDGQFLAFVAERDGRSRIWLQRLDAGNETALTDGPDDSPRFSPDGSQVLFSRAHEGGTTLYRAGLLGGDLHKIVDDAGSGDWSPDGRQVVFVRFGAAPGPARSTLMLANVDGSDVRALAPLADRDLRPRWSPDGKLIAVTGRVPLPGAPQRVLLVPVDGSPPRDLPTPGRVGLTSSVAWDGPGALIYSEALSVNGNNSGSQARVVRQRIDDGRARTLLWTLENSLVLDRWPGHGVVFDARSAQQTLVEVEPDARARAYLSRGTATDRQPVYAPDGEHVVFSSNRGTSLDLWRATRHGDGYQRLTDDPAEDWDPALSADGRTLLWSSNRSGNLEIWMADADGAHARQVTHDTVDAENPSLNPDGTWVIYSSGAPERAGVWRIRPDGTEATRLVADAFIPDISPDGKLVLFQMNQSPTRLVIGVARLDDGQLLPFEIRIDLKKPPPPIHGRARWVSGGRAIAFLGQDERGRTGVFVQPFAIGADTSDQRRPLAGFEADRTVETFAVAPDGARLILAEWEQRSAVVAATELDLE